MVPTRQPPRCRCVSHLPIPIPFCNKIHHVVCIFEGIGNGFYTIALAEVTHGCNNKDRTSVISTVLAARQFGLLVGQSIIL
mgnify:CR=1 FL=1